jgi:hypothetical protein
VLPSVGADTTGPVGIAVAREAEGFGVLNGVGSHFCVVRVICGVAVWWRFEREGGGLFEELAWQHRASLIILASKP